MKQKITTEFLTQFYSNLLLIFPLANKEYIGEYIGTGGWSETFKKTCIDLSCNELFNKYDELEWYASDLFDCFISDSLIKNNILI